jgi:hypothetical protein
MGMDHMGVEFPNLPRAKQQELEIEIDLAPGKPGGRFFVPGDPADGLDGKIAKIIAQMVGAKQNILPFFVEILCLEKYANVASSVGKIWGCRNDQCVHFVLFLKYMAARAQALPSLLF